MDWTQSDLLFPPPLPTIGLHLAQSSSQEINSTAAPTGVTTP